MNRILKPVSAMRDFMSGETAGGLLLLAAAVLAMIIANSPLSVEYIDLREAYIGPLSLLHWINDFLMAGFFMLVGLEMKRELIDGNLANWSDRRLPVIAALGGMIAPALIYLAVVGGSPQYHRGWAIPAATDIAFSLGILAMLGKRVPVSLKLFLVTVAIVDDLLAIIIIAVAYTAELQLLALVAAAAILAVMFGLNKMGVARLWPYLALALALWVAVYLSGIHATIAGVAAAFTIPLNLQHEHGEFRSSPLHRLEHNLHPWIAFFVVPLFGLFNGGVPFRLDALSPGSETVVLAIAAGLFLGKQAGVFGAVRATVALGIADRPWGASWLQVYGVALLCGIGFTMSLFIGGLAFVGPELEAAVKLGVLGGSLSSGVVGALVLLWAAKRRHKDLAAKELAAD